MKNTSCGFIIHSKQGILACHPTGKPLKDGFYDLSKGHLEEGENPFDTAIRELKEETDLNFFELNKGLVKDLGLFNYRPDKDLYLFYVYINDYININKLNCKSMFINKKGETVPEMDDYKFVQDIKCFYPNLQKVLLQCNQQINFLNI